VSKLKAKITGRDLKLPGASKEEKMAQSNMNA
jgi:hypothetical protein